MSAVSPFVFGKLPAHGDFISRGLAAAARDAWDDWAGAGLAFARERLGEAFGAAHEQAPAWRFALEPGALGPDWQTGALAPSVDRVGRRFLIVVGVAAPAAMDAGLAGAMEALIYRALAEDWTADVLLAAALTATGAGDGADDGPAPAPAWVGAPADGGPRLADVFAPDALLRMLTPWPIGTPT